MPTKRQTGFWGSLIGGLAGLGGKAMVEHIMAEGDNSATGAVDPNTLAALLQQTMTPNPDVQQQNAPISGELQAPPPTQQPQVSSTPPPSNQPPRMGGMPLIAQYLQAMIKGPQQGIGPSGYPMQPQSRGDMTLNFLGQFLGNMAQGLSQAGHGPGANLRGAGAAMQAPYQRSLQDYQVQQQAQQQQAQLGLEQARTQAQVASYTAQPRFDPQSRQFLGVMTDAQYTQYLRGLGAAKVSGEAGVTKATIAAGAKQAAPIWGKLTPQMAAVGVPPDPKDYALGMKDPKFLSDVKDYGKKVTDLTQQGQKEVAAARGESYALGRARYMQIPILTSDENGQPKAGFATALDIAKNPMGYQPMAEGDKLLMKNAVFQDIQGASKNLKTALNKMPEGFSTEQIASMTAAMDADPSGGLLSQAIGNMARAGAKDHLSNEQQATAIAMQQAYENAYALRSVAGLGQGSDELRRAIRATLPGPTSPKGYALNQLTAFDQQVSRLSRTTPMGVSKIGPEGGNSVDNLVGRYK